jgi:hypothetical protein
MEFALPWLGSHRTVVRGEFMPGFRFLRSDARMRFPFRMGNGPLFEWLIGYDVTGDYFLIKKLAPAGSDQNE